MTPSRLPLAAWCLVGLLFASSLAVPLILTLTVTGCGDKGEVRGGVPDDEDEDEPAGPPFFKDVTAQVGLDKLAGGQPWFYTHGAAVADYDRDGWPDLLVTGWDRVALFHNEPVDPANPAKGRRLVDVTGKVGLDKLHTWSTSAGFADLDGDGFPELYLCCYVDWSWENHPKCVYAGETPDICGPEAFTVSVAEECARAGIPADRIHFESFVF